MCGINGFSWRDESLLKRMNNAIIHRGPDDHGVYIDDYVSLGHLRLSIIDLSLSGRQPMTNEDKSIQIIFNGEIYNFQEIREELQNKGHKFSSKTDTEVVIHAYEEFGYDCLERFNGMWAFALYDKNKRVLFLSRDRFGIKPIYYHFNDDSLIFSSEIKALLKHDLNSIPNDKIIYEYLAFGILDYSKETFFKGIYRLMPGENLVYDLSKKSMNTFKWYDFNERITEKFNAIPEKDVVIQIRDLFVDSVDCHLVADVPVGSCLSGGIDSSAIVVAMRRLADKVRIKTFSLVFPGLKIDESSYIDEIVKVTKVESHKVIPTTKDLMEDLNDLIWTQEEPFRSLSIYGQYKVMEMANKIGMKVLLDGQGADEIFAGYHSYYKNYLFESLFKLRLKEAKMTADAINYNVDDMIIFPVAAILARLQFADGIIKRFWLNKAKYLSDIHISGGVDLLSEKGFDLNRALNSNLTKYMLPQLLRYEDKNSMRWSIESRVPFLDYRLVELVSSLPSNYKIRRGVTKYIFRKAIEGMVPDRIVERRDKIGFATPDDEWMASPSFMRFIRDIITSAQFKSRSYWKQEEVVKVFEDHVSGRKDHSEELWRIINVELWLRIFIDGAY